ncbi:M48 family metallopeptidase [Litorilituus lipolyticus]|uniref:Peptidase M48 domain-containing protein n=1 Tax=Litorilituus lipolyticus TaxID=2491017 RepID=A0A502KUC7_9GAMM|nr:M48 family metallopeptidase [Litorilituus lipolyticus]TPH15152.1 hypothetical protein EPA86_10060 [Litorilituus lipolyticus]
MIYRNPKIPEGINYSNANPVKEFALLASGAIAIIILAIYLLGSLLDWSSKFIPFAYEQELAEPWVKQFKGNPTTQQNEVAAYLQRLADDMTPLMALEDDVEITLHYVNSDTVNGVATLGGNIFIFRGLLEKLPSENALAMLLAHEIVHVKLRHPVKALSKGALFTLLYAVLSGQSNTDVSGLFSGTSQFAFLGFSRSQEQAADDEALRVLHEYYRNTQGASELFNVLLEESQQSGVEVLSVFHTHPEVTKRLLNTETVSGINNWPTKGQSVKIPAHIQELVQQNKLQQSAE